MEPPARDPDNLSDEEFERWWRESGEHELRQILFWKWDPIGVHDSFPNTADEYDEYAPQIVGALRSGAPEKEVVDLLHALEHEPMGLGRGSGERAEEVAELLAVWIVNSQDSWRAFGPLRR